VFDVVLPKKIHHVMVLLFDGGVITIQLLLFATFTPEKTL